MAVRQPSGTVTLVFTDIEGSTRLLHELGQDAYREALGDHRRVVREAFDRHSGYEVDYEGDAFFYAFASAADAVAAVGEAQAALDGGPIRIRVGVHTGEPALDPPKYVGMDVHLAARVMSAGHGGQVLLSKTTRDLVDAEVVDLGEHRLKDIDRPVCLYQLGERRFPPLKTISNTNLPRPASSFLGREQEVAEVVGLVRRGGRLLTLTGPGGTGKTRLAIEAASALVPEFKAGVFWVGLAGLRDPALVLDTIGQTLGVSDDLASRIGGRELLLLLDNFEQVVAAAPELASLVESCPSLSVLVTSRELLRVRGEREYRVDPLAGSEAVGLFCERSGLEPGGEIAELCRRLDNLPLAIELAAARTKVLTPAQILDRLGRRLDLLSGGRDADPRQQTLRATIEWSYDLLAPAEQKLLARLAVFAGGCLLETAEAVAGADVDALQALVEKSLLRQTGGRFWMLETIRDYAAERLSSSGEAPAARRRLADWVVSWGGGFDARREDQAAALLRLRQELPNIRDAVEELRAGARPCELLSLVSALAQGMFHLGATRESREWLEEALESGDACPAEVRARAHVEASVQSSLTRDPERGASHAADAARLASGLADAELRVDVLTAASVAELASDRLEAAERRTAEALACAEELGDPARAGELRNNLAYIALRVGDLERARSTAEAELSTARQRGNHALVATLLHTLFLIAFRDRRAGEAAGLLAETLELSLRHSLESVTDFAVEGTAAVAAQRGAHDLAATLLGAASPLARDSGPEEDELRRSAERAARAALGERAFEELTASGAALGIDEAAERSARWLLAEQVPPAGIEPAHAV
jgi:predicted ATPase